MSDASSKKRKGLLRKPAEQVALDLPPPGMGRLLVESLTGRDYPVLMASFMLMAVLVLLRNLLSDLSYGVADPRIRLD